MSEATQETELAVDTAPVQELTAAPEPEVTQPEDDAPETAKTFTQEELDAIVAKRLAREQRKWDREQAQRAAERSPAPVHTEDLTPDDFDSVDAYAEALAERKAEELLAKRDAARQQSAVLEAYQDREEEARSKYDDFEEVAYNPKLPISDVMAQSIQSSDIGPEIAYHLGSNPKEAERISKLPPLLQAKEIGKLEASLVATPPTRRTSSAPAPIAPVTARTSGTPAYDTTDPRSVKTMTTSEWIEADRQRMLKKLGAN